MIEIGVAGALLLLLAWLFETYESIKKHKALVDLKFALIYITSTILLAVYSYQRNDQVFFIMQLCLIVLVLFEIFYTLHKTRR
jgi:lipid-A-disaccharide synthase-like uncharacterized protein